MDNGDNDDTPLERTSPGEALDYAIFVRRVVLGGWASLIASSIILYCSTRVGIEFGAYLLILARIFGMGAFLCGVFCLANQMWNHGSLLLILSLVLPFFALLSHGSM
ncbi:MAG: hypothetical protein KDD60_03080 [Bdellovibrionales bacterium]|nr:hypothetical protein [Bdellovibrionales bacterium]